MDKFTQWFIPRMMEGGFLSTQTNSYTDFTVIKFNHPHTLLKFDTIYVKRPVPIEVLRILFESEPSPLLIVVDSSLVDDLTVNNPWLCAIHALYYGRIYAWDGKGILAIHHDKRTGALHSNGLLSLDTIVFTSVDCWYPGFPGVFHIVRFNDVAFWRFNGFNDEDLPPKRERKQAPPRTNPNEEFWKGYYQQQTTEDVFRDFREAFERNKRTYEANNPPPSRPPIRPTGDKWLTLLLAEGTLEGAKKKFRELAHAYHPDKVGDSPEVIATMQLINAAYARAKEILT